MFHFNRIKKIIRSSGIYAGIGILSQALSFLLLPILTRYLSPFYYGILATFKATYGMGEHFVNMGSTAAVARSHFDKETAKFNLRRAIFNSIIIKLFFTLILSIVLFFLRDLFMDKFNFPIWLIYLIPLIAFAATFTSLVLRLWVVQKKVYSYSMLASARIVTNVALSLILIVVFGLSWKGRVWGIMIAEVACMVFCAIYLVRKKLCEYKVNPAIIKGILKFGIPIFIYSIGRWTITLADRFFLNTMVDISATGIYSVAYSMGSVIEFIAGGVSLAVMPILFEKLRNPTFTQKTTIVKYSYLYFAILFIIALGWIFIAPYFLSIFISKNFAGAVKYIPWITLAYFANAVFRIISLFIVYSKKTYYLTYSILVAAIVNIILNYILIKANGAIGAAQSTLIAYCVNLLLVCFFVQKAYPMPWFGYKSRAKAF